LSVKNAANRIYLQADFGAAAANAPFVRSADLGRVKMLRNRSNVGFQEAGPQH